MIFAAVLSFFSNLLPTILSPKFVSNLRSKHGESILVSIRHCGKASEKLQKAKCNIEFLGCCLAFLIFTLVVHMSSIHKNERKNSEIYN